MGSRIEVTKDKVLYEKDGQVIIHKRIEDLTPEERVILRKHRNTMIWFCLFFSVIFIVLGLRFIILGIGSGSQLELDYIPLVFGILLLGLSYFIKRRMPF